MENLLEKDAGPNASFYIAVVDVDMTSQLNQQVSRPVLSTFRSASQICFCAI